MSLPILANTDFTSGDVRIAQNASTTTNLNSYISTFEKTYIRLLLNDLMYSEIRDNVTLHSKYTALINGVDWYDSDGDLQVLTGLKEALKYFIYYHFVGDNFINTPAGNTRSLPETSEQLITGQNKQISYNRLNSGIDVYRECLEFVDYYQKIEEDIDSVVESPAGTYTISVGSTLYLEDGDVITYDNTEYTVSSVVADTSFVITGASGLSISGSFYYEPFKDAKITTLYKEWL